MNEREALEHILTWANDLNSGVMELEERDEAIFGIQTLAQQTLDSLPPLLVMKNPMDNTSKARMLRAVENQIDNGYDLADWLAGRLRMAIEGMSDDQLILTFSDDLDTQRERDEFDDRFSTSMVEASKRGTVMENTDEEVGYIQLYGGTD